MVQRETPAAEYMPAAHLVHADWPVVDAYWPLAQFEQTFAPAAEYIPRAHEEQAPLLPVEAEKVPAAQLVQAEAPVRVMYLPIGQPEQREEPAAENLPAAQLTQEDRLEAPGLPEALPAAQLVQAVTPCSSLYLPEGQAVQTVMPELLE